MTTEGKLIIRPTSDFSVNGSSRGTLVVYDEHDTPVWEHRGNWSDRKFLYKAAQDLAESLGVTAERASGLLNSAVTTARLAGNAAEQRPRRQPAADLETIVASGRQLPDISDECWDILAEANRDRPHFFWRGGVTEIIQDREGRMRPRLLTIDALGGHLARRRNWVKVDQHGNEFAAFPPERVMRDMLAFGRPPLPTLMGVTNTPVLSPSGEIVTENGYNSETGLFIRLDTKVPRVPPIPYEGDVGEARRLLLEELLGDFPFASTSDKTHVIALMLTVIVRSIIHGPTPLFMFEAPSEGSGKSLLADACSEILVGGPPMSIAEVHGSDDEWRKRITGLFDSGALLVRIDNIKRELSSSSLAKALTDQEWTDRIMGSNRIETFPVKTVWMATANNPRIDREIKRRTVRIRIVPMDERPWEREGWRHDPLLDWVKENRGQLLWALLTLVNAWIAKDRPAGKYRLGSYESWASVVGGILDVVDMPGFLANRAEQDEEQQSREVEWRELVLAWANAYGSQRVFVGDLFQLAKECDLLLDLRAGKSEQSARTLMGNALNGLRQRVIADYIVTYDGVHAGAAQYKLYAKPGAGTAEGHQGSPGSPVQVTLGDPGDPLPYLAPGKTDFSHPPDSVSNDAEPECGHIDFYKYTAAGELYCAVCNKRPLDDEEVEDALGE